MSYDSTPAGVDVAIYSGKDACSAYDVSYRPMSFATFVSCHKTPGLTPDNFIPDVYNLKMRST